MSKKANKTAIGAFVVGAVALLICAILILGSGWLFKKSEKYILFFDGNVKGLSVGAPVVFKGVMIGAVTKISLLYNPKSKTTLIAVITELQLSLVKGDPDRREYPNRDELIKRGLRARMEVQSFITGQLMISFDFYPDKPLIMQGIYKKYPELPALPISPDIFAVMAELPIKEISDQLQDNFVELKSSLQEVTKTARSVRLLVEYLELHPEALLKGKPGLTGEKNEAKQN